MKSELMIAAVCAAVCAAVLLPVNAPAQAGAETNTADIVEEITTEAVKVIEEEGWTAQDVNQLNMTVLSVLFVDNRLCDFGVHVHYFF